MRREPGRPGRIKGPEPDPAETEQSHAHDHGVHETSHGGHGTPPGDNHRHRRRPGFLSSLGHHHRSDPIVDTSHEGMRVLKWSLAGLAATAMIQLVIVIFSGSVALFSESIHNFADALTALPLGIAFVVGRKRPNSRYTYGYGRAEDLAGIAIVLAVAASSAIAFYESISRLVHPEEIRGIPFVMMAGVVGFIGNEAVALYRIRTGRRIGSAALTADGLHARTDGLASLAVVLGALGAYLGFEQADPIASLVIGIAIFGVVREAARDIYRRLMDSVDPDLVERVREVLIETPGIQGVEAVHIRWIGHELRAEVDVLSAAELSLVQSHLISEEAHHRLLHEIPRLSEAVIHTSPKFQSGHSAHSNIAHHFPDEHEGD